ncbi:MAG: hypothetical protein C0467_07115 [Planctomycetaceae bacterium]|nr:hypothetical protein [Planctomycetaceae bacterium]
MCHDPLELIECLNDKLTDGERLLILTAYTRPVWTHPTMVGIGVNVAMDRLERAAYGELNRTVFAGTAAVIKGIRDEIGEARIRHSIEGMSVQLCHEVAQWVAHGTGFNEVMEIASDLLRRLVLFRPSVRPSRPMMPNEIPWEIFVHLEGGIDGRPSIWKETFTNCRRLLADTIREIIASPYVMIRLEPGWLDEDMVHGAFTMFQSSNFEGIERLGERLEDRGCGDSDILLHCTAERHHRGCWLIDEITAMRQRLRNTKL